MTTTDYIPLSNSFTAISIIGFFISIYIASEVDATWGLAFMIAFLIMFLGSFISMHRSMPLKNHMTELEMHKEHEKRKKEKEKPFDKAPNSNNTKAEMKEYLDYYNIDYDDDMLKDEIYDLVKEQKQKE